MARTQSTLLTNILIGAAATAIKTAAASADTSPMAPQDAPAIIQQVNATVAADPEVQKAAAVLEEATTPVAWYASPVFLAMLVSFASSVMGLAYGVTIPEHVQTDLIVPLLAAGAASLGGLIARLKSPVKPITTSKK